MKKFNIPRMEIRDFGTEDVLTGSDCLTEALGCASCYCSVVGCVGDALSSTCDSACYTNID